MSDCKYVKKIKGRPVGHVFLIDNIEMSGCQALEYLQGQGFSSEESKGYLDTLKVDEEILA